MKDLEEMKASNVGIKMMLEQAGRKHYGHSLPDHQLQTVAAACGYDLTNHHHALADAEACAHIAIKLL